MELWLAIVIAVVALGVGIAIGRAPLGKLNDRLSETLNLLNSEKIDNNSLRQQINVKTTDNRNLRTGKEAAESATEQAVAAAVALHKACKNGDKWSDHTAVHPEGLTPARREAIAKQKREAEIARQKQAKLEAEAAAKREKERKAAQEKREKEQRERRASSSRGSSGYSGYNGATEIAVAAAVTYDSPASYSPSCDTSSVSSSCDASF